RDAVAFEESLEELRVPLLLVGLHGDRVAEHGVGLDIGHPAHACRSRPLARNRFAPERQRAESFEARVVQIGPRDLPRLVRVEGVRELPAEEPLVLLRTNSEAPAPHAPPFVRRPFYPSVAFPATRRLQRPPAF